MYEFNADLELRHVSSEDRIAVYHEEKKEEDFFAPATALIGNQGVMGNEYIVASFNGYLHCTNAQGFTDYHEAWRDFDECREIVALDYMEEKDPKEIAKAYKKKLDKAYKKALGL